MNQAESIANFESTLKSFTGCIAGLDDGMLLAPLNNWSPRDIVAHLIGWNDHIIKGSRQVLNGELPFYDIDPGEGYCKVNAAIIEQISSTDKEELLEQLAGSAQNLKEFISTLSAEDYSHDFGVRHNDEVVTVGDTFEEMIADYSHHEKQIVEWAQA